ncbi:MAG: hypothetical protein WC794_05870 [Candidatus Doudnabacteria bacterium]|jgi:hypothetical protein
MKTIKIITIIFGLVLPLSSLAAGLQISPSRLNFTVAPNQEMTQKIVVANPTADVQIYEITADDYTNFIKPQPKSFTLESGARKEVAITVMLTQANQKVATNLSVVAKPLTADGLTIGTGAKIPLEITVIETIPSYDKNLVFIVIVVVLVIIIIITSLYFSQKRKIK